MLFAPFETFKVNPSSGDLCSDSKVLWISREGPQEPHWQSAAIDLGGSHDFKVLFPSDTGEGCLEVAPKPVISRRVPDLNSRTTFLQVLRQASSKVEEKTRSCLVGDSALKIKV